MFLRQRIQLVDELSELALWQGPCQVRVEFKERGMEKNISVFAKEYHGD